MMTPRNILIAIVVIIGLAFLLPSNSYTDPVTKPVIKVIKKISSYFGSELDIPMPVEETRVYKWQDENGEWHFSNTPPPKNVDSESKIYKSDDNVVPAPEVDNNK
ncbi:DUF4124 domain-containing protein [Kaarinaea lacus]